MPRMEIELTSKRDDGTWTWRAAGAKLPKGSLAENLLDGNASIGDVIRVETEQFVDGISVTSVLSGRDKKSVPELLEIVGSGKDEPLVTSNLQKKKNNRRRNKDERSPRASKDSDRRKPARDKKPTNKKPTKRNRNHSPVSTGKRLKQKHVHRDAIIASLPEEMQLFSRQLSQKGIAGMRSVIEKQNEVALSADEPPIPPELLLKFAEQLQPQLRTAEWRDKAEAALEGINKIDLRDLRSVVVASDTSAKDSETRDLANQLKDGLVIRIESEHAKWVSSVEAALQEDRIVRALRLSSHPPKAGAPLSEELLSSLTQGANDNLNEDTYEDRWVTVLDAVALSPVRERVVPQSLPKEPSQKLIEVITELSMKIPSIAALFGVSPVPPPRKQRKKAK